LHHGNKESTCPVNKIDNLIYKEMTTADKEESELTLNQFSMASVNELSPERTNIKLLKVISLKKAL